MWPHESSHAEEAVLILEAEHLKLRKFRDSPKVTRSSVAETRPRAGPPRTLPGPGLE